MKVLAVPGYSTQPYPYDNITQYVKMAVEKMGPERCHWGTDVTRLMDAKGITYKQTVEHFTKHMGFSDAELDKIMGKGLCDILDWKY